MAEQPVTPGKGGTTTTTTPRLSPPSGNRQPQRSSTSVSQSPDSFDAGREAAKNGDTDLEAKIALLRQRLLSGEDVSLAEVGTATVLDEQIGVGDFDFGKPRRRRRSINDLLNDLTNFSRAEVQALQRELYAAGYFPASFYDDPQANPVEFGNRFDFATRRAYGLLLADGLAYGDLSIDRIMKDRSEDFAATGRIASGKRVSRDGLIGGGKLYQTVLDDPAALRLAAEDLGIKILGRKPSDEEMGRYVKMIQGLQKDEQQRTQAAEEANTRRNFDSDVAQADANTAGRAAGKLTNPVSGGNFSDTLGADRDGGARKHKGTDIFGKKGDPVLAPVSGEVVKSGDDGGNGGLRVWIKGDDGRAHYLAHLDSITVPSGRVEAGQPIGTVGNTGNASTTAPHVHYSINSQVGHEDAIGNPALELNGLGVSTNAQDQYLAPTSVTTTRVDASARLAEQIRKDNPNEAAAHDIAEQYQTFRSIIGMGGS